MTLNELPLNTPAEVIHIAEESQVRRRVLDLGITLGLHILAQFRSPANEPTAYLIRGTTIALRDELASQIEVAIL